LLPADPCFFL
jgi:hypothetical protein